MAAEDGTLLSPPHSATTAHFRQSIHLIPTPPALRRPKSYEPPQLKLWLVSTAALFMIALGIALEIALSISQSRNGFAVPERNAFRFASQQFLTSFVPICFVVPLVWLWESKTWLVKRYQPYINLSRGYATAEDSILLDYISLNSIYAVLTAFTKRHWLVFVASVAGLSTAALQPLAGSIFNIKQVADSQPSTVTSIRSLGLDPTLGELSAFVSAAGYVQAAVTNNLPDPPFINANWASADFVFPTGNYLNGTVAVRTIGIRSNATCTAPTSITLGAGSGSTSNSISAASPQGCFSNVTFNPAASTQQYGVSPVGNCGPHAGLSQDYQPVFFWFYRSGQNQVAGVFCAPTLEVFNIIGNASLNSGELLSVTKLDPVSEPNNVTGAPLNGIPFNAVIFNTTSDDFINARATATRGGVPGAILSDVEKSGNEDSAFGSLDGFLSTTSARYTQHLSLVAKNTYFLAVNSTLSSTTEALKPRLALEPLASHALAIILFIIGLLMFFVGIRHHMVRRGVYLSSAPGSIGSATSLTSHSGFGILLNPYDTDEEIAGKMGQLLFSLDGRTGAITAIDRPDSSYLVRNEGNRYADDTMEKDGKVSSPTSLSRVNSREEQNHPVSERGFTVEPYTHPGSSAQERA